MPANNIAVIVTWNCRHCGERIAVIEDRLPTDGKASLMMPYGDFSDHTRRTNCAEGLTPTIVEKGSKRVLELV